MNAEAIAKVIQQLQRQGQEENAQAVRQLYRAQVRTEMTDSEILSAADEAGALLLYTLGSATLFAPRLNNLPQDAVNHGVLCISEKEFIKFVQNMIKGQQLAE